MTSLSIKLNHEVVSHIMVQEGIWCIKTLFTIRAHPCKYGAIHYLRFQLWIQININRIPYSVRTFFIAGWTSYFYISK